VCSRRSTSSKLFPSSTGATLRGSLTHSLLGLSSSFTTQLSSPPAAPCCAPHQQSYGQFNDIPIYPLLPGRLPFIMHLHFTAKVFFQGGFCVSAHPEAPPRSWLGQSEDAYSYGELFKVQRIDYKTFMAVRAEKMERRVNNFVSSNTL
jgi:hypothetical protein